MKKILILHVEAGYGHKKVAESIAEAFRAMKRSDLTIEIADALDRTNPSFKKSYPRIYFQMVKWAPWLWGWFYYGTNHPWVTMLMRPFRRFWNWINSKALENWLCQQQFDVIVFTHFFPAEVCASLKREGKLRSLLVTVVTDVIPHSVWQNEGTDVYWVMADESREALLRRDPMLTQIEVKGIPISSIFSAPVDAAQTRSKLGLSNNRFTILLTSGSFGIGPTEQILTLLNQWKDKIQAIVVCGQNKKLYQNLNGKKFSFPLVLLGFVNNMHELMSVSDLMFAKPGGATMCESLAKNLPMLMMSPIPGQETYNARWLVRHGAAFELRTPDDITKIMPKIFGAPEFVSSLRAAILSIAKPNASRDLVDYILDKLKT